MVKSAYKKELEGMYFSHGGNAGRVCSLINDYILCEMISFLTGDFTCGSYKMIKINDSDLKLFETRWGLDVCLNNKDKEVVSNDALLYSAKEMNKACDYYCNTYRDLLLHSKDKIPFKKELAIAHRNCIMAMNSFNNL
jgi:hypothetical protein